MLTEKTLRGILSELSSYNESADTVCSNCGNLVRVDLKLEVDRGDWCYTCADSFIRKHGEHIEELARIALAVHVWGGDNLATEPGGAVRVAMRQALQGIGPDGKPGGE